MGIDDSQSENEWFEEMIKPEEQKNLKTINSFLKGELTAENMNYFELGVIQKYCLMDFAKNKVARVPKTLNDILYNLEIMPEYFHLIESSAMEETYSSLLKTIANSNDLRSLAVAERFVLSDEITVKATNLAIRAFLAVLAYEMMMRTGKGSAFRQNLIRKQRQGTLKREKKLLLALQDKHACYSAFQRKLITIGIRTTIDGVPGEFVETGNRGMKCEEAFETLNEAARFIEKNYKNRNSKRGPKTKVEKTLLLSKICWIYSCLSGKGSTFSNSMISECHSFVDAVLIDVRDLQHGLSFGVSDQLKYVAAFHTPSYGMEVKQGVPTIQEVYEISDRHMISKVG